MENTKTNMENTKTNKQFDLMDFIDSEAGKKRMDELFEQDMKEYDEMNSAFMKQHDFSNKPDRQTRSITSWTRENILLDGWNTFIEFEAKQAEFAGWEEKGKGFRTFNERRRCDVALGFAHWFLGYMKESVKQIDEEVKNDI